MGFLEGSLPICPIDQHCSKWAMEEMNFCLCGTKDAISLSLGLLSVLSWGVAEIPQIITNYREKSTEGLSLAFLVTWIVGDLFNLLGCKLEPATLPTQYYMALLYTITTTLLTSQTIYYGHIYHRLKARRGPSNKGPNQPEGVDKFKTKNDVLGDNYKDESGHSDGGRVPSSPIPVGHAVLSRYGSLERDMYYMSARSLTTGRTPTSGSHLASRSFERTAISPIRNLNTVEEPLLAGHVAAQSAPHSNTKCMLCVISVVMFFVSSFDLNFSVNNTLNLVLEKPAKGVVIRLGRKLLQDNVNERNIEVGSFLGWAMAAIYMGGRLPQIWLNIRRGNVEGLNPLMFVFALFGNITYVGSILVSSMAWSKIRPNLPWLVDAGGCVLLDSFILIQFIYFYRSEKHKCSQKKHGDCSTV